MSMLWRKVTLLWSNTHVRLNLWVFSRRQIIYIYSSFLLQNFSDGDVDEDDDEEDDDEVHKVKKSEPRNISFSI